MIVPLSWLKDYVDVEERPEDLAEDLLLSGTKVDNILEREGEVVFELEITPNRADCLGIIGIAREIATLYNKDLQIPEPFAETMVVSKRKRINLVVSEKNLCPYYTIGVVDATKIQESPSWLKKRLEQVGIRPINNVVDITNYVMLETAQPMHAFDYSKVKDRMVLRAAKKGERVVTLDGIQRTLNEGAIIIEDSEKLIDLAGLMGGENTQIDENTQTIVLHVPIYNSVAIRRASQHLGLRTEASNRFEKMLDPNGHRYAFERALHLLKIEAGATLASEIKNVGYPVRGSSFAVDFEKIKEILGLKISEKEVVNILVSLGFEVLPRVSLDAESFEIRSPSWRPDVKITEDIAEEIGRIWGYNRFPKTLPSGEPPIHEDAFTTPWSRLVRETLKSFGFSETYSHSMTSTDLLAKFGENPKDILRVSNRMTLDYEYLRPSLLIGLLQSAELNLKNFSEISLYEIGRVFSTKINPKTKLPYQPRKVAAVSTSSGFYEIKGVIEEILKKLNVKNYRVEKINEPNNLWADESAKLVLKEKELGILGRVSDKILKSFSIEKSLFGFELDLEKLVEAASTGIRYTPLPKYPSIKEDLSIAADPNTSVQDILDAIRSLKEPRIKNVKIAEAIPWRRKKSVLLKLEYYDPKKTLTNSEAEDIRNKIIEILKKKLGAQIR